MAHGKWLLQCLLMTVNPMHNQNYIAKQHDKGPIMHVETDFFELSANQKYYCQLADQGHIWVNTLVVELQNALNFRTLTQVVDQLAQQHETLVTTFQRLEGRTTPVQSLHSQSQVFLSTRTLEAPLQNLHGSLSQDLSVAARHNIALIYATAPENCHYLVVQAKPELADRTTLYLLLQKILQSLQHQTDAETSFQYLDVVSWQAALQDTADGQLMQQNWHSQLKKLSSQTMLPFQSWNPSPQPYLRSQYQWSLNSDLRTAVSEFAHAHSVENEVIFLACWNQLLSRFYQDDQQIIGVTYDARHQQQLSTVLGPLATTVPVNLMRMTEQLSASEISSINTNLKLARQNVYYFSWPAGYTTTDQGFNAGFVYQPADPLPEASLFYDNCAASMQQLVLCVTDNGNSVHLTLQYNPNQYAVEEICGLAELLQSQLMSTCQSAVNQPLPIPTALPQPADFLTEFRRHASQTPNGIALTDEQGQQSYAALDNLTDHLQRKLQMKGVRPGDAVVLLMERSSKQIQALLATLKAGGYFVPLEPDTPPQRLQQIIRDTDPQLILSDQQQPELTGYKVLTFDEFLHSPDDLPSLDTAIGSTTVRLAYMIYTSGSTGRPKGVKISSTALAAYLSALQNRIDLTEVKVMSALSSVAADLAYTSLFGALGSGRQFLVVPPRLSLDSLGLERFFHTHKIDCLKIVPSHLAALTAASRTPAALLPSLLILGGELSPPALLQFIQSVAPQCRIYNHYGPTETTIGICADASQGRIYKIGLPAGRPLSGVETLIVTADKVVAKQGETGELWVSGPFLADGYHQAPELTDEKFVIWQQTGTRYYKTGDKARQWPSGKIEILGRIDEQLKFSGHRLEPGEIEALLNSLSQVASSVVKVVDIGHSKQLVAYLIWLTEPDLPAVKYLLEQHIPPSVRPSAFVTMQQWPLNSNGKIDRQALPLPPLQSTHHIRQPQSAMEQSIADLWQRVLKTEQQDTQRSFFNAGGNSLLLIELKQLVQQTFSIEISVVELFQFNTIESLARHLDAPTLQTPSQQPQRRSDKARQAISAQRRKANV